MAPQCEPWDRYYSNIFQPGARRSIELIDPLSGPPFRNLSFVIRPCAACTIQIARAARLIAFEQDFRQRFVDDSEFRSVFPNARYFGGDHLTKATEGYRADEYPPDIDFTDKTGAIYMPAVRCSKLILPAAYADGSPVVHDGASVEYEVRNTQDRGFFVERYDALQYFEWSWELSVGTILGGPFNTIEALPPPGDCVRPRLYNRNTSLWEHPFSGEWADMAEAVQTAPFQGKELSNILRTYTINGVKCDRSLAFLAPDCFAPTLFSADVLIAMVKTHAALQRERSGELGKALNFVGAEIVEKPVVLSVANVYRSKLYEVA